MAAPTRVCPSCETPLPAEAGFCPSCGEATPTEISGGTGTVRAPETTDTDEQEYRGRLQRALGESYELRELIGRGGFGAVYAAWDVKLEREVAVKALRHDLFPTSALLERFEREGKTVAKLRHPNILPVYTVGEGEGIVFMVMPRVDGESLKEVLHRGDPIPVPEVLRILSGVADALAAAHEGGVIHRDVKPENIMLEGRDRRVLLMDFGIAKAVDASAHELTGTDMVVGTPYYMSPEQASGERDIDRRTDVFSLGVVGYQLLTGRRPFSGDNARHVLTQLLTAQPVPVTEIVPDVNPKIANVISKCLAKDPEERWQSAAELSATLRRLQGPVEEPPTREAWFEGLLLGGLVPVAYLWGLSGFVAGASEGIFEVSGLLRLSVRLNGLKVLLIAVPLIGVAAIMAHRRGMGPRHLVKVLLRQPRWWTGWYPRTLRGRRTIWPRLPWVLQWHHTMVNALALFYLLLSMPVCVAAVSLRGDSAPRYYVADVPFLRTFDLAAPFFEQRWWLEGVLDNISQMIVVVGYFGILVWLKRKGLRLGEAHAVAGGRAIRANEFSMLFWKRHNDASWLKPPAA